MICRECNTNNFVAITKKLSQNDIKNDSIVQILVCKTCDPVTASLKQLEDGFSVGTKILGLANNPKMKAIVEAYSKFGLDKSKLIYSEDSLYVRCKGTFSNGEQFEVSCKK